MDDEGSRFDRAVFGIIKALSVAEVVFVALVALALVLSWAVR